MGLALVGSGSKPTLSLADIPGMLRKAADTLDNPNEDMPETFLYVKRYADGEVTVGAFGDSPSKCELIGLLMLAASQFTSDGGETVRGSPK